MTRYLPGYYSGGVVRWGWRAKTSRQDGSQRSLPPTCYDSCYDSPNVPVRRSELLPWNINRGKKTNIRAKYSRVPGIGAFLFLFLLTSPPGVCTSFSSPVNSTSGKIKAFHCYCTAQSLSERVLEVIFRETDRMTFNIWYQWKQSGPELENN